MLPTLFLYQKGTWEWRVKRQQETVLSSPDSTIALFIHRVMTVERKQAEKGRKQP